MATEDEIHAWLAGYPRDWDQLCQALMWQLAAQFGNTVTTPPSAIDAYWIEENAGRIAGGDAPPGAFVYWDIGTYGHVGFVMNDGRTLMATSHLAEQWVNRCAGWQSSAEYERATGARPLGWSYQNGGNTVPFETGDGYAPAPEPPKVEEADMPIAIAPNTLIWPNGFTSSYRQDVFDAMVWGLGLTVHDTDWTYDTILREAWTASDFMTSRQATAAAGAVAELLKDHEHPTPEEIERAIREALRTAPKPPGANTDGQPETAG
jgi:hypothetical protein